MRRALIVPTVLALLFTACSDDDSGTGTTARPGTVTTGAPTTTAPSGTAANTSPTTTAPEDYEQLLPELGLPEIVQLTPTNGGGTRPILEWEPVDGAAMYFVAVVTRDGEPYWAWRTDATAVPVGGEPRLDEGAFGPAVSDGMAWSVTAVGADGELIAISARRPISP